MALMSVPLRSIVLHFVGNTVIFHRMTKLCDVDLYAANALYCLGY